MSVESARPAVGRHRETKVAEKGSSVTAASGSVGAPLTRISNLDRMRVSRTKSPWAARGDMSPALVLMAKVDSSTRVTTSVLAPSLATGPSRFHGSAIRVRYLLATG